MILSVLLKGRSDTGCLFQLIRGLMYNLYVEGIVVVDVHTAMVISFLHLFIGTGRLE